LLVVIIFIISYIRTHFDTEYIRAHLEGKSLIYGNVLAALFGIITPFCSCSAIPLFLGFIQARIPLGVTFSYLISAPMNNEVAIAMLFTLFGWKIAAIYIGFGLFVAIVSGYVIELLSLEKYILLDIKPIKSEKRTISSSQLAQKKAHVSTITGFSATKAEISHSIPKTTSKQRVKEAWQNTIDIIKNVWLYVLIGVAIGALIHGVVPQEFVVKYAGGDRWYSVPLAVLLGVPMYSSAAGVMPLVDALTNKGMLLGTALSFMMAITALSLPEAMILKKILHTRLITIFFGIVAVGIICIGYLFNFILK